ncbi:23S rRNA pseudouridine(1911/1915/1917) synthase RluD [Sodalis-like secondary symbiont of Drepanosiphum platanoidis]|uniref:23S rRNA pseudouridine(1911/1915/1917) synthase RluD n=1 Tax=Sodalis-like secondary symbiont of Drepanosiphum platanoidis TaxID=2994493 RepID=UPI0034641B4B
MILKNKNKLKITNVLNKKNRLDKFLSKLISNYSRSYIKKLIINGYVKINKKIELIPKKKVIKGDKIEIKNFPKKKDPIAENINLNIVYEDSELIIINKKNNIVVHPGAGNLSGTILNSLLYHYPFLKKIPRAGIVHRLDKNTTGLMIIAKSINSYNFLVSLLKSHKITREYEALVYGTILTNGKIDKPIMRNKKKRTIMMVHPKGKKSITHYKIINNFNFCTHLKINLETGRTHQIRVHMSYIKHPIIGDKTYIKGITKYKNIKPKLKKIMLMFHRQSLHAKKIKLIHPISKKKINYTIDLPKDMLNLIKSLKNYK